MGEHRHHRPVLLSEAVEALNVESDGIYVDGTYGRGGHAAAILARLGNRGRVLAIDKDPEAVQAAQRRFQGDSRFSIEQGSFAMTQQWVQQRGWLGQVNGVLLDLGVSSPQLDAPERGFGFSADGPLDMRMDPEQGQSAADWLAEVSEKELSQVLRTLGEERYHRRIARAIVEARKHAPVTTTWRLAEIVTAAVPTRERHKHPATRTFQAIRIHINRELEELEQGLRQAVEVMTGGGRLVVVSFHSLEDRIVKRFIRDESRGHAADLPPDLPVRDANSGARLRPVGRAVRAGSEEIASNPRARSAVMRVAERTA